MIQEEVDIPVAAGNAEAIFCRPDNSRQWPGVIHLTDAGGIRPAQIEMVRQLAAEGYAVLAPNVFYRTARPPVMDPALRTNRELMMQRVAELTGPLTPEAMESDATCYVDFLQGFADADVPIGVVGYCFSGAFAMRMAAARADRVGACASFHGGGLYTDSPNSPHLVLPRIQARLYFAHADKDPFMPAEAIRQFESALAAWGGEYESETYAGAYHSWTAPDSPVYHPAEAQRAFGKLEALLAGGR